MDHYFSNADDINTLEQLYDSFDATFDFLSDDMKHQFIAQKIRQSASSGDNDFFGDSPRCKKLRTLVDYVDEHVLPSARDRYLTDAVAEYLQQKKSEKKCSKNLPASTLILGGTPDVPATSYTSQPASCPHHNVHTIDSKPSPELVPLSMKKKPNLEDVSESRHLNVAAAMDFLGPAVLVQKTQVSTTPTLNIPRGWFVRVCTCYNPSCTSKFYVSSPTNNLSSAPGIVHIVHPSIHLSHHPIDWMNWYLYSDGKGRREKEWDDKTYPRTPGMPFFIKMAVQDVLHVSPQAQPAVVARLVCQRFNDHPLLLNPGTVCDRIVSQIKRFVKNCKVKILHGYSPTVTRINYTGDIWEFIKMHRINYDKLDQMGFEPRLVTGPEWIRALAFRLREHKVLSGLGRYDHVPERDLIVLDSEEVTNDDRWIYLKTANDKEHCTGPDPRRRTVVFTSMSLLGNASWCQQMDWEVCGTADGTHGMSKSSYKLLTLGVFGFSASTASRTFHPLIYVWGEGEREVVALHGFLNLRVALRKLFGIKQVCFKRGVVCDATPVFANAVQSAFPMSPLLSCYPHIIRKFKVDNRKGNGHYVSRLSCQPKQWLAKEAEEAIRKCHLCKTDKQKEKMWELTKQKWNDDGESKLAETFERTYLDNTNFSRWNYTASGQHGCVPCNNPMERHNLYLKGATNFEGIVEMGKDMHSCLTKEFVTLIYRASTDLVCPGNGIPVIDYSRATKNNDFMKFQSLIDPAVDIRSYGGGWLVNDVEYLASEITDDDVMEMEMALAGIIEDKPNVNDNEDVRCRLLERTRRFHMVKQSVWPSDSGTINFFQCDCRDYFFHRWCFASAYMQHRDELQLMGEYISKKVTVTRERRKATLIRQALETASMKVQQRKVGQK